MATYQTEIAWSCVCGESGTLGLMYPDDDASKLRLLRTTHRAERGCELTAQVRKRLSSA
jgi:hypothetical protein